MWLAGDGRGNSTMMKPKGGRPTRDADVREAYFVVDGGLASGNRAPSSVIEKLP